MPEAQRAYSLKTVQYLDIELAVVGVGMVDFAEHCFISCFVIGGAGYDVLAQTP